MGQSLTYDCASRSVVALPEHALPESMVEWGVSSYEWRTMCVQEPGDDGAPSVSLRLTRFCPETGCSSFDDLVYDERTAVFDAGGFAEDGAGGWCHGPGALPGAAGGDALEWEACVIARNRGGRVERVRVRSRHSRRDAMRPSEVVLHRERFARSRVAIAEDYLNEDLSREPGPDVRELAAAAGFAGRPRALQSDASIALLPSGAFAGGCVDGGVAHVAAGCRGDDGALRCWARSYDLASGALLDAECVRLQE